MWFALLLGAGALRDGYDPVRQYMTELTSGPTAALVNADFFLGGVLIAVFAIGLWDALGRDRIATVIALLVLVKAAATIGTGLVHGDVDPLVRTPSGQLHNTLVAIGNVALAIACLIAAWRFPARWRGLTAYNVGTAVLTIVLLVVLATMTTGGTARADAPLANIGGLVQRLSMFVADLWPAMIGWRMLERTGPR